jgi:hypothetical protein
VRDVWKPILLLVVAAVLFGWGLQIDPDRPRCGPTPMTPEMVCSTQGKGGPQQRDYAQMVTEARAWQVGLPLAGGVLAVAGITWLVVLVRRRNQPPQPVSPWDGPGSPVTPVRHPAP